jgi:hypothetical protein
MSNQEPQNQNKTTEEMAVEKRRRFIKGASIAAPVVLTLSSPSVFGAFCRSEIMSGNESHTTGSCVLGENRNYWKDPRNRGEWQPLGFDYGTPNSNPPSTTDCSDTAYTGGATFRSVFGGISSTQTMRSILCGGTLRESYYVAAILDAKKDPNYILSFGEVIELWNNPAPSPAGNLPPGYATDVDFLVSTLKTTP